VHVQEPNGYFPPMPPAVDGYFPPAELNDVTHEILRDPSTTSSERRRMSSSSARSAFSEAETDFGMEGGDARSSAATSRMGDEGTPESVGGEEGDGKEKKDARSFSMSSSESANRDRRPPIPKTHSDETPGHVQATQQARSRSVTDTDASKSKSLPSVVGLHSDQVEQRDGAVPGL